jgi:hypothetical protein
MSLVGRVVIWFGDGSGWSVAVERLKNEAKEGRP